MRCAERGRRARPFPLALRAARTPDAPALVPAPALPPGFPGADARGKLAWAGLDRFTAAVARALLARGVVPGERVALRLAPSPVYPVLLLALLRAGGVAVPLSTRVPDVAVPGLLARARCRRLVAEAGAPAAPAVEVLDAGTLLADAATSPARPPDGQGEDAGLPPFAMAAPATVVFSSGSTGVPKAALHSFGNHWASAVGANRNLPLRPGDRWLLSLPLWHVGGLSVIFRCVQAGAVIVVPEPGEPLADAILGRGITHVSLVATQLRRLLGDARGREALRALKGVLLGGGPLPAALLGEAATLGARLVASYGSTESASQATATCPGDPPEALLTAGQPLRFREIAIAPDGEILVRGRTLFLGYLEEGEVREARDTDGWFHSGDLGRLDAAGRLLVEGRRDAMFVSGGENVHPEEIERELARVPGVLEAIVVPLPDAEFGARPAAFLRTVLGGLPDAAALGAQLRATLPGFKVPVRYLPWPDLDEGLKPDRRALARLVGSGPCAGNN